MSDDILETPAPATKKRGPNPGSKRAKTRTTAKKLLIAAQAKISELEESNAALADERDSAGGLLKDGERILAEKKGALFAMKDFLEKETKRANELDRDLIVERKFNQELRQEVEQCHAMLDVTTGAPERTVEHPNGYSKTSLSVLARLAGYFANRNQTPATQGEKA